MKALLPVVLLLSLWFSGSVTAQAQDQSQRATAEVSQRGNARIFYWGQTGSVGQLTIDYGQPAWNQQFDAQWQQLQGKRWRLGQYDPRSAKI